MESQLLKIWPDSFYHVTEFNTFLLSQTLIMRLQEYVHVTRGFSE